MNYNYFEQEGSKFHLKSNNNITKIRFVSCVAVAIASFIFFPSDKGLNLFFAVLFAVFAVVNLLKMTKKLAIDTGTKTVIIKENALFSEKTYPFADFIRFNMETHSTNFVKTAHLARMVFEVNGKEKNVNLLTSGFTGNPTQTIINEVSEIMGIEM